MLLYLNLKFINLKCQYSKH